jgi:hypothetical protein
MSVDALDRNQDLGRKWPVLETIRTWLEMFDAARECAAAVEGGKRPSDHALRALGIDPAQFNTVKL